MVSLVLQSMISNLECTSRVNPNVNIELRLMMMCQCGFICCNKGITLLGNVDDGAGCACVKAEGVCKSLHLLNFAVNIKLLLKDKVFNNNNKK